MDIQKNVMVATLPRRGFEVDAFNVRVQLIFQQG